MASAVSNFGDWLVDIARGTFIELEEKHRWKRRKKPPDLAADFYGTSVGL